jgi:hypothetical protein
MTEAENVAENIAVNVAWANRSDDLFIDLLYSISVALVCKYPIFSMVVANIVQQIHVNQVGFCSCFLA